LSQKTKDLEAATVKISWF